MKDKLYKTNISKIYVLLILLISIIILVGYFSYAMFTVEKVKNQAISIAVGTMTPTLVSDKISFEVNGLENIGSITLQPRSAVIMEVTMTNQLEIDGKFQMYYKGDLPSGISIYYTKESVEGIAPEGVVLAAGESKTYELMIINNNSVEQTITIGGTGGLSWNPLILDVNMHTIDKLDVTEYQIITNNATEGSISIGSSGVVGQEISFTPTPSTGYSYNGATITNELETTIATLDASTNSFIMPASIVTITPKWKANTYAISKRSVTGGSVSASSTGTYGSTISFTTSPSSGFSYAGATIRNSSGTVLQTLDSSTKSFTMPAQAVTISPKWQKSDYTTLWVDHNSACAWSSANSDGFVMTFGYNSSRTYFYFSSSSTSNARLDAYSNCTFDLTHYKTLRVGAYEHGGSGSKHVTMHIGVSQSRSTWVHQLSNHATISGNGNMVLVYPSIDITNLTGNYYIGFQTLTNSQVIGVNVVEVKLFGRTYE